MHPISRLACRIATVLGVAATCATGPAPVLAADGAVRLRVVGGLGALNQYTRHERPFWTVRVPEFTEGRVTAEIVPFDEAGLSGVEMLRLMQTGAVPLATALLPLVAARDPELGAPDLAGLNPDMATLRRHTAAFRPHLATRLRERWGVELLAVYVYPAQVTFCRDPFANLSDLAGRRIRTSSLTQSDFVEAIGAVPVQTAFAEILPKLRSGDIECAITGTMSGYTIGLHQSTRYLHTMALNWGLAVFGANIAAWQALDPQLRSRLQLELGRMEQAIWDDADRETGTGVSCSSGTAPCPGGPPGEMTVVRATQQDMSRWRGIVESTVLPRWLQRCGPRCATVWNETLAPVTGTRAPTTQ